ncbi:COX15/CtaA family protein [Leucobacter sp. GX24907]
MPRSLRFWAWCSFVLNVIIIGTGGAVRLTGSGLGCSEWPLCTPDSLVPTQEMGIHGIIEFGNRTITGLLLVAALGVLFTVLHAVGGARLAKHALRWALVSVLVGAVVAALVVFGGSQLVENLSEVFAVSALAGAAFSGGLLVVVVIAAVASLRREARRRDLPVLAWIVLIGIMAQAFVGGITVLTDLHALIVGFHYVSSLALVCVTAAFLVRMYEAPGARERAVPLPYAIVTHVTTLFMAVTIFVGVLTTGAGPHSGDADVIRDGFDATLLSHIHAWPGYISLALVLAIAVWAGVRQLRPRRWSYALLAALLVQIAVGIYQARNGLPPFAVGVHMVLASLTAAAMTVTVLRLKQPAQHHHDGASLGD